eukprot:gnl/TRDRNA2_/TRDRNA2_149732_c2_seq2.p1 gnl/TRDRNA2_/TRDRNA2_149732_c2~~gnl/TRDRNA2_/TRDRNA2_149732_c2_seq2.p1  ORF type:complete len:452 (+),score=55.63 gnl/TRDRNA2_/TRDRNA2_149732_c2_seq2:25-1356(+)
MWIDLSLARPAPQLKYRSWAPLQDGYMTYKPGFLRGNCTGGKALPGKDFDLLRDFSTNYFADLVDSARWAPPAPAQLEKTKVIRKEAVWFWRESFGQRKDSNLWHAFLGYINVYIAMLTFSIDPREALVLFLDHNLPAFHEDMWSALSGGKPPCGLGPECWDGHSSLLFERVTIVGSMGQSPHNGQVNWIRPSCGEPVHAQRGLALRILQHYGLDAQRFPRLPSLVAGGSSAAPSMRDVPEGLVPSTAAEMPVRLLLVARRKVSARKFANEDEMQAALRELCESQERSGSNRCEPASADMAEAGPIREQIALVSRTDALLAAHGAACTFMNFLPRYGGFMEIMHLVKPKARNDCPGWCTLQHMASWAGLSVVSQWWPDDEASDATTQGNGLRTIARTDGSFAVDIRTWRPAVERLVDGVRGAKFEFFAAVGRPPCTDEKRNSR